MSLFERLNNKRYNLQEGIDSKGNVTPNPGDTAKEKSILRNYNKQQKNLSKDISQRVTAQDRQQQLFNRQYDAYDDGDLGNPTQTKSQTSSSTYKPPSKKKQLEIQNKSTINKLNKGQMPSIGNPKIEGI